MYVYDTSKGKSPKLCPKCETVLEFIQGEWKCPDCGYAKVKRRPRTAKKYDPDKAEPKGPDANKYWAEAYQASLYLKGLLLLVKTNGERHQLMLELGIAENKCKIWERHPNFVWERAYQQAAELKKVPVVDPKMDCPDPVASFGLPTAQAQIKKGRKPGETTGIITSQAYRKVASKFWRKTIATSKKEKARQAKPRTRQRKTHNQIIIQLAGLPAVAKGSEGANGRVSSGRGSRRPAPGPGGALRGKSPKPAQAVVKWDAGYGPMQLRKK